MSSTLRRWLLAAVGVAVVVASVHLCGQLAQASDWASLGGEVRESVRPRPGAWRLLRGTLHFVEIPALFALAAAVGYAVWRRDRRAAVTFAGVLLLTNVVVQGVKHGPLSTPDGLNPLSGHAGLAAGLCCAWVLTGVGLGLRWRRTLLVMAAVVLAGTGGAIILTGWHTLPQVLAPIGIGGGCALVGRAVGPAYLPRAATRRAAITLLVVAVALGVAGAWGVGSLSGSTSAADAAADADRVLSGLVVLLAMVVAGTCAAVGLVCLTASTKDRSASPTRATRAVTPAN